MQWIWQLAGWPNFEYNIKGLKEIENNFIYSQGIIIGATKHINADNLEQLQIEILTQEGVATSTIEGEILKRDSVQSSIRRQLGLQAGRLKIKPGESGIAELMVDLYKNYNQPLTHELLFEWHKMINNGRRDLEIIGGYRQHADPMQIVSGNLVHPKLFYEAPPSAIVKKEMNRYIKWYNSNVHNTEMPTIIFAGIAHLYFENIHPFEDGNGRIGRALVEKAISQRIGMAALNSFSQIIEKNKKAYYNALQTCNQKLDISQWLEYFAKTIIEAQEYTNAMVGFLIAKTKFFSKYQNEINERQEKVLLRVFEAGLEGFKGGLSAGNYKSITGASAATVTRDLQQLVEIGALTQTGLLKHTRYHLQLKKI